MTNESNTSKEHPEASKIADPDGSGVASPGRRRPHVNKPGTETLQLPDFPSDLLTWVNNTAGYLETPRLDLVVRILEAAMIEIEVPGIQEKLKKGWAKWCQTHPKIGDEKKR